MISPVFKRILFLEFPVLVIALISIAAWHFNLEVLNDYPDKLLMSHASAITFVICVLGKIFFELSDRNKRLINASRSFAALVIVIGVIRIAAIIFNIKSIEFLFFFQNESVINAAGVNSMAVITAFTFIIIGLSIYMLTLRIRNIIFPQILSLITLIIALLFGIAFVFNDNEFLETSILKPMESATALSFALIAFSVLRVNKHEGILVDVTSKYQGSEIARVLIPMAIVIPIILSLIRLKSEEIGLYEQPYGIALFTVARIAILVLFIWRIAVIVNRSNKNTLSEIEEHKKTEQALQYRKALLEAQNEAIPDGVLIVNNEGEIISYNHRIAEIWRIPEDILNKKNDELARKYAQDQLKDPETFIRRVNEIYSHPEENSRDEIEFADGRIVERYGNAVEGEDGTRYGWAWYFRDITSQKHTEQTIINFNKDLEKKIKERTAELVKSEKRFRSIIENANDIISLSDENGIRFYISPAIERVTGFSIEETINQPVFNIVYPDDVERVKKLREDFMSEPGVIKELSCRFKHKNGGFIWIEGTLINLLHDENVKAIVGNYHDVTEAKRSAEKIRISNERFEIVSKATNDAVWDWDLITDELYWNKEIKSMFNYDPKDIPTGKMWEQNIHPDDIDRVSKKINFHIDKGIEKWQDEYRFRCADGSYKDVFDRGFILYDATAKPYRMIGAMQDLTEVHLLQKKLIDEKINKQKELIKASIEGQEKERTEIGRELHDNINQLLTATKLYLDVASTQPALKDDMIKRSQKNLSNCMEEIRKLSSALVAPSVTLNSFSDIIRDLIEPIKLATPLNIQYEVDEIDNNIITPVQLLNIYRIIQEHLNNILKHSGASNVFIFLKHKSRSIHLTIRDDGQGFEVEAKRNGIGFKNIQSRSELLDGSMEVISKPGEGCLLQIIIPLNSLAS